MAGFLGFVDDAGNFAIDDKRAFRSYMQKFKGHEVIVDVKKKPRRQGTQQIRYYYGVVIPDLARACGLMGDDDDRRDTHEGMAWKYLRVADGPFGNPRRRSVSPKDLSMEEMSSYLDQVITWAETSIPDCHIRRPEEADVDGAYAPYYDDEEAA